MTPSLLLCHVAIGRDVVAVRDYVAAQRYAGVEWGLDSLRVAVARGRRARTLDGFRQVGGLDGVPAEVLSATYLGTAVRYRVRLGEHALTVDDPDPTGRPLHTGPVRLTFDPARLCLWPATPEVLAVWHTARGGA